MIIVPTYNRRLGIPNTFAIILIARWAQCAQPLTDKADETNVFLVVWCKTCDKAESLL